MKLRTPLLFIAPWLIGFLALIVNGLSGVETIWDPRSWPLLLGLVMAAFAPFAVFGLFSFIGTADSIPVSGVEAMHAAFDAAQLPNAFQVYEGAQHAFFNDTRASYNAEAATDAWARSLAWFGEYLLQ